MTLGGYSVYCVCSASMTRACLRERQCVRCLLSAAGRLDLSVARSLSHTWLMLKHALRNLQNTCVVLRAHYVIIFLFGSFRFALKPPVQVKKVSKRNRRSRFRLHVANGRSHGTGALSVNAAAWVRTRMHAYVLVAGGTHGIRLSLHVVCTDART